jgi:hypothetical protein
VICQKRGCDGIWDSYSGGVCVSASYNGNIGQRGRRSESALDGGSDDMICCTWDDKWEEESFYAHWSILM